MQNAAMGPGNRKHDEIASGYVAKIDWLTNLNRLGSTASSIDYARNYDARFVADIGKFVGLFAYQNWDEVRLDCYAGYRTYEVQRPDILLYSLDIYVAGLMFTF
jgi:hypothetical protein